MKHHPTLSKEFYPYNVYVYEHPRHRFRRKLRQAMLLLLLLLSVFLASLHLPAKAQPSTIPEGTFDIRHT